MNRTLRLSMYYLLAIALVLLVWAATSWLLEATRGREILPTPWVTFAAAAANFGTLASAFGSSALRFLIALAVAFLLGLPLGLAVGCTFLTRFDGLVLGLAVLASAVYLAVVGVRERVAGSGRRGHNNNEV